MSMNLNLALVNFGPGQHISLVRTSADHAPAYAAPGVWATRHEMVGNQSLYIVSHWGEHTTNDPMSLPPVPASPAFLMDAGIQTVKFGESVMSVEGHQLNAGPSQFRLESATSPAATITQQFSDGFWFVRARHLIPSLHPIAYTTLDLRVIGSTPDFSPVEVSLHIPGADPIILSFDQLAGCRCHLSTRVMSFVKIADPSGERNRAIRNAHLLPHRAKVVPVLP